MRIAFFSEFYLPHIGGVEFRVRDFAAQLAALGHDVTVYTTLYTAGIPAEEKDGRVKVVRCPARGYDRSLGPLPRNPFSIFAYAWRCRQIARGPFDVLIYEEFPFVHALLAPRCARRKAIFDWCERRDHPLFMLAQRFLPRMFRWNTATSPGVAAKISADSGCKVLSLPSGVFGDKFSAAQCPRRSGIVYLGRLFQHKNLPLVISSFDELCRRGYGGTLTIVGNGPEWAATEALARASDFASRIIMTGEVDDAAKVRYLAEAELMFQLSSREGFPVTMSEAMVSGLPIVTVDLPNNGGSAVVETYGSGLSVAADPKAVSDAALQILGEWDRWSRNCLEAAKELEWPKVVDDLLSYVDLGQPALVRNA